MSGVEELKKITYADSFCMNDTLYIGYDKSILSKKIKMDIPEQYFDQTQTIKYEILFTFIKSIGKKQTESIDFEKISGVKKIKIIHKNIFNIDYMQQLANTDNFNKEAYELIDFPKMHNINTSLLVTGKLLDGRKYKHLVSKSNYYYSNRSFLKIINLCINYLWPCSYIEYDGVAYGCVNDFVFGIDTNNNLYIV